MREGDKVRSIEDLGEPDEDGFLSAGAEGVIQSVADSGPFPIGVKFGELHWFVWPGEIEVVDSPFEG